MSFYTIFLLFFANWKKNWETAHNFWINNLYKNKIELKFEYISIKAKIFEYFYQISFRLGYSLKNWMLNYI